MAKIKKGDKVKILSGKDRGKTGKVIKVLAKENKVVVEGINIRIKHARPRREREKGQRIQFPAPLDISKVMPVCPKCGKSTRVGFKKEGEQKMRVCRKCHSLID